MNHKNLTQRICFFVFYLFALIGVVTIVLVSHELIHKKDYGNLVYDGKISLFVFPEDFKFSDLFSSNGIATYEYNYDTNNMMKVNEVSRYTEYKAYGITSLIFLIFLLVGLVTQIRWIDNGIY